MNVRNQKSVKLISEWGRKCFTRDNQGQYLKQVVVHTPTGRKTVKGKEEIHSETRHVPV